MHRHITRKVRFTKQNSIPTYPIIKKANRVQNKTVILTAGQSACFIRDFAGLVRILVRKTRFWAFLRVFSEALIKVKFRDFVLIKTV